MKSKTIGRVLYLADRNILIDQTMQQDFKPFAKVMCKVGNKNLNSAFEVFMSLYHQLAGNDGEEPPTNPPPTDPTLPKKYYVNGVEVNILNERVQYIGNDGRLITESLTDYSRKNILQRYATLNNFISEWTAADKTGAIIEELITQGVFLDELREISGKSKEIFDDFDLILHIAYDKKPLTRRERVANVKKRGYLYKYSDACQKVLNALLDKYQDNGIDDLENPQILRNSPFSNFGSPASIVKLFGGKNNYLQTIMELKKLIYEAA